MGLTSRQRSVFSQATRDGATICPAKLVKALKGVEGVTCDTASDSFTANITYVSDNGLRHEFSVSNGARKKGKDPKPRSASLTLRNHDINTIRLIMRENGCNVKI